MTTHTPAGRPAAGSTRPTPGTTMRAVVRDAYGPTETLRLAELPVPTVADDEVLVRVHAAGLDRGAWHLMTGRPYPLRLVFGLRAPRQPVLGSDLAGTVAAVGSSVTTIAVGDEVFGVGSGTFAEHAVAKASKLAPKPRDLTFEQAAVVPESATTALQALHDVGRVAAGQRVLVVGASGGVGSYAVQLAKAAGAEVTAVCSTAKIDFVRSLGADRVIDYTRDDFAHSGEQHDLVLDIGGSAPLTRLRRALAPRGTAVLVGGEGGGDWAGGLDRQLRALVVTPFVRQRLASCLCKVGTTDLLRLSVLLEAGSVVPQVDRVVGLEQVPDAMRRLERGEVRGKIAITT